MMNLKRTTLANSPELLEKTLKLIEEQFHYSNEHSFYSDFYPLMFQENHNNCHLLVDKDKNVIAHIGLCKRTLAKKQNSTKIYLIGGIAVDSAYQGQGIFKDFFHNIINEYEQKCSFFLLWSEKNFLYSKYDFHEFGCVIQTGSDSFNIDEKLFTKTNIKKISKQDLKDIKSLYNNNENYIHLVRTNRDWENIFQIKGADLYIKREEGRITNYFFVNKGADLKDIIHEINFLNNEELINSIKNLKLWLPEKHKQYISYEKELFLALIRVNVNEHTVNFLNSLFNNEIIFNEITNKNVSFTYQDKSYSVTMQEFIHLSFGPNCAEEFKKFSNYFYISGLDSI